MIYNFYRPQLLVDKFLNDFGRSSNFMVIQQHQLTQRQVQFIVCLEQIQIQIA